jgi:hypothetical protein
MAIGSAGFSPSVIEDNIYDLINQEKYLVSSDEYTEECVRAVESYLTKEGVKWNAIWDPCCDMSGYSVSIAWIEDGELHHIVLNARKDCEIWNY